MVLYDASGTVTGGDRVEWKRQQLWVEGPIYGCGQAVQCPTPVTFYICFYFVFYFQPPSHTLGSELYKTEKLHLMSKMDICNCFTF